MHDDMIRDLSYVRYVSSLKKNLISASALEVKGGKIHIQDGVLKIVKGAMIVM